MIKLKFDNIEELKKEMGRLFESEKSIETLENGSVQQHYALGELEAQIKELEKEKESFVNEIVRLKKENDAFKKKINDLATQKTEIKESPKMPFVPAKKDIELPAQASVTKETLLKKYSEIEKTGELIGLDKQLLIAEKMGVLFGIDPDWDEKKKEPYIEQIDKFLKNYREDIVTYADLTIPEYEFLMQLSTKDVHCLTGDLPLLKTWDLVNQKTNEIIATIQAANAAEARKIMKERDIKNCQPKLNK